MTRNMVLATLWIIACLTLLIATPTLWPFAMSLAASRWLTITDDGHEAHIMALELRKVLNAS